MVDHIYKGGRKEPYLSEIFGHIDFIGEDVIVVVEEFAAGAVTYYGWWLVCLGLGNND